MDPAEVGLGSLVGPGLVPEVGPSCMFKGVGVLMGYECHLLLEQWHGLSTKAWSTHVVIFRNLSWCLVHHGAWEIGKGVKPSIVLVVSSQCAQMGGVEALLMAVTKARLLEALSQHILCIHHPCSLGSVAVRGTSITSVLSLLSEVSPVLCLVQGSVSHHVLEKQRI